MSRDRMPPLDPDRMTGEQRAVAAEIAAGRRGSLIGPFVPALRSPEFTRRLQHLGEYLRYDSVLAPRLRELAILLTAREWSQDFEWYVHAPIALDSGLASATVEAIAEGRRPEHMPPDEALIHDFIQELHRTRTVSEGTYTRAVGAIGEQGVIELVGAVGYYTTLAMIMNAAGTPLPPGEVPVLRPLPAD